CDNDAHFLKAEEHDAHDTLICISTGKIKHDPERMRYTPELYVKSPEQMREVFQRAWPEVADEACDNTLRIAQRCNVDLKFGNHAPVVEVVRPSDGFEMWDGSESRTAWFKRFCARYELLPFDEQAGGDKTALKEQCDLALRELCEAGLVWRYGEKAAEQQSNKATNDPFMAKVFARLERELGILADKDISAYFLIVWDFVNWARQRGIPSLARGSGVGTMVGYLLGLSNACPIRYGLLFERFTDPDRSEYPDIDIDLCQDGRQDVINYVREKYGHVAQIITFGTLKARAAIRDIGRVLDVPLGQVDKLAKLIPDQLKMTFKRALEEEPRLRQLYEGADANVIKDVFGDPANAPDASTIRQIIDTGSILEGQARHSSVHAAGVIVATRPLHEIVPLYRPPGTEDTVTQWDGPTCEDVGLLKMDFLGLRTLSIIERCMKLVNESLPEDEIRRAVGIEDPSRDPLDLEELTYDDPKVFELFRRGDTTGVFQFESGGMRRLLLQMKPDRLEDLIAANALYRPGPMDLIPDYNARKHGEQQVPPVHEIVDRFTAETYGIMVYQEQVMQIVHELGGIPLRSAYTLIKAISKKKEKVINENRPKFIEGAGEKGLDKKKAEELFDLILKFAGYGFNKSHSTGYAIVAYRTAYLKTYFPKQYMAAFLSYESQAQKVDDWIAYLDDCRRTVLANGDIGVEVKPPDVNASLADFAVVFDDEEQHTNNTGHVRFGLKAIKGVGSSAIDAVVAEREKGGAFKSLYDFCERVPPGTINKATIEALVCCGAFDSVHIRDDRCAMVASIEQAVSAGQMIAQDRAAGQGGLFGGGGFGDQEAAVVVEDEPALIAVGPWDEAEMLVREKESLGFYVSAHPLDRHERTLEIFGDTSTRVLKDKPQESGVIVGAMIKSVRAITTRKGDQMAILTLEDKLGTCDAVVFPRTYAECGRILQTDEIVFVEGTADHTRGDSQVVVDRVIPIAEAPLRLATALELIVDGVRLNGTGRETLETIAGEIQRYAIGGGGEAVPVSIAIRTSGRIAVIEAGPGIKAMLTEGLLGSLRHRLGDEGVRIKGGRRARGREGYRRGGPARREVGNKEMCASVDRV
ncbi:MAG: DNA polymerase III subunit alpha, partial [Planctomycetota bacterium]